MNIVYEHTYAKNAVLLGYELGNILCEYPNPPVFLCVGESRVIADCLGPLVGNFLTKKHQVPAFVYGNLQQNVTNENLQTFLTHIRANHPNSPVVVVDSALGSLPEIGHIKLTNQAIVGGFTNKQAKPIGNVCLLGVVNTTQINSLMFLKSVKLKTVFAMANFISNAIALSVCLNPQCKQTASLNH